ncbi:MAG: hypothetical protein AB1468_04990 [Candidatus Micrarchaeota archaeon]
MSKIKEMDAKIPQVAIKITIVNKQPKNLFVEPLFDENVAKLKTWDEKAEYYTRLVASIKKLTPQKRDLHDLANAKLLKADALEKAGKIGEAIKAYGAAEKDFDTLSSFYSMLPPINPANLFDTSPGYTNFKTLSEYSRDKASKLRETVHTQQP